IEDRPDPAPPGDHPSRWTPRARTGAWIHARVSASVPVGGGARRRAAGAALRDRIARPAPAGRAWTWSPPEAGQPAAGGAARPPGAARELGALRREPVVLAIPVHECDPVPAGPGPVRLRPCATGRVDVTRAHRSPPRLRLAHPLLRGRLARDDPART